MIRSILLKRTKEMENNNPQKRKKKKQKSHFSLRAFIYGVIAATGLAIITYALKGIWPPSESIHFVAFATVTMAIVEDFV